MTGGRGPGTSRFALTVLTVVSVSVIALDLVGFGPVSSVRDGALAVLGPVRSAGESVFGGGTDPDEVERLETEIERLRGVEATAENLEAELRSLQERLGVAAPLDVAATQARVVSSGPRGNFDRQIEIDKGANAGIKPDMPVVSAGNLVGIIDRVTFNRSTILLLTDPDFRVGVIHAPSQDVGVLRGSGEGQPLVVFSGFDATTEVFADDAFLTSGVNQSFFPPEIPVGRALNTRRSANPLEQEVLIGPLADLDTLSVVSVLLYEPVDAAVEAPDAEP